MREREREREREKKKERKIIELGSNSEYYTTMDRVDFFTQENPPFCLIRFHEIVRCVT